MINKEKTIKKAVMRYHDIYPVKGKSSIEDCFFCLRGEYYFIFRTKDKKIHRLRAEELKQAVSLPQINKNTVDLFIKALNKPILLRSMISKKPGKTCLVNIFPSPGIAWSSNTASETGVVLSGKSENSTICFPPAQSPSDVADEIRQSQGAYNQAIEKALRDTSTFYTHKEGVQDNTASYHYEILAPGSLPVHPSEWMPAINQCAECSDTAYHQAVEKALRETGAIYTHREGIQENTSSYHYEILATGSLPVRPSEWMPSFDETVEYSVPVVPHPLADDNYDDSDYLPQRPMYEMSIDQLNCPIGEYPSEQPQQEWRNVDNQAVSVYLHERPQPDWNGYPDPAGGYGQPQPGNADVLPEEPYRYPPV